MNNKCGVVKKQKRWGWGFIGFTSFFPFPLFFFQPLYGDLKNFLSHPVVEGVLGSRHPAEVGAVGLRGQRPGEGARRRAGERLRAVRRLRPVHGLLQGQRGVGHAPHVDLLPGRTHV